MFKHVFCFGKKGLKTNFDVIFFCNFNHVFLIKLSISNELILLSSHTNPMQGLLMNYKYYEHCMFMCSILSGSF